MYNTETSTLTYTSEGLREREREIREVIKHRHDCSSLFLEVPFLSLFFGGCFFFYAGWLGNYNLQRLIMNNCVGFFFLKTGWLQISSNRFVAFLSPFISKREKYRRTSKEREREREQKRGEGWENKAKQNLVPLLSLLISVIYATAHPFSLEWCSPAVLSSFFFFFLFFI